MKNEHIRVMHGALPYKDEKRLAAFNIADGMMKKLFDRIYSKFEREQQYYSLARTESANDPIPVFCRGYVERFAKPGQCKITSPFISSPHDVAFLCITIVFGFGFGIKIRTERTVV